MVKQRRTFDLESLTDFAELKGGKLVSNEYKNSTTYLLWECKAGHRWKATALEVVGKKSTVGSWCPRCPNPSEDLMLNLDNIELDGEVKE